MELPYGSKVSWPDQRFSEGYSINLTVDPHLDVGLLIEY